MKENSEGCSCSVTVENKIIGGQETKPNEFPWMSALVDKTSFEIFCGASIISTHYALTAAHCFEAHAVNKVLLLVGDHDIHTDDTAAAAVYRIDVFISHPFYNNKSNDIGVVKTVEPILFSPVVGPVCLPFRRGSSTFERETVTVLGWGVTEMGGHKSNTLQKVNLSVMSNNCSVSTTICTYSPHKDSCNSDSGGPLLWKTVGRYELVGLVSYGGDCAASSPAVNTRVTSFLAWIASVTGDDEFCIR